MGAPDARKQIIARFHPQSWINDYAYPVDPEGETTWDVTDEIVAMGPQKALALHDDEYATDDLRFSKNAPKWIQEWSGPFYVEVSESIWRFYNDDR